VAYTCTTFPTLDGTSSLEITCHRLARHHFASKKMSHKEDIIPKEYAYSWIPTSDLSLDDFLKKARVSQSINTFNTNTSSL
jgi:hypothetical protein